MDPVVTRAMTLSSVLRALELLLGDGHQTKTSIDMAAALIKHLEHDGVLVNDAMPENAVAQTLARFELAVRAHRDSIFKPDASKHASESLDGAQSVLLEMLNAQLRTIVTVDAAKFTCAPGNPVRRAK